MRLKKQLAFWRVTYEDSITSMKASIILSAPRSYNASRIKSILSEVKPRYSNMKCRKIKQPKFINQPKD